MNISGFKKAVSLFVVLIFAATIGVFPQTLNAVPIPAATLPSIDLNKLEIPAAMASLEERFVSPKGVDGMTIITIQDAHGIFDAQKNIKSIIQELQDKHGFELVGLEGGAGRADHTLLRTFPNQKINRTQTEKYMKRAELSGGEAAAILNPKPGIFYGVEDRELYFQNRNSFLKGFEFKDSNLHVLNLLSRKLDKIRDEIFPSELLEFHKAEQKYLKNQMGLLEFIAVLEKEVEAQHAVSLKEKYPNILLLFQAMAEARKKPSKEAMAEKEKEITAKIQGRVLFEEIREINTQLKSSYYKSSDIATLDHLYKKLEILESLASLEITREDWDFYQVHRKDFEFSNFTGFLKKHGNSMDLSLNLEPAETFYRDAIKRDGAMYDNLTQAMKKEGKSRAVLVTGGFHANGFRERMQSDKISYIIYTPRIEHIEEENPYLKVMEGKVSYRSSNRSSIQSVLATMGLDPTLSGEFTEAYAEGGLEEVVKQVATRARENQSEEVIQQLNQIEEAWRNAIIQATKEQGALKDPTSLINLSQKFVKEMTDRVPGELKESRIRGMLGVLEDIFVSTMGKDADREVARFTNGLRKLLDYLEARGESLKPVYLDILFVVNSDFEKAKPYLDLPETGAVTYGQLYDAVARAPARVAPVAEVLAEKGAAPKDWRGREQTITLSEAAAKGLLEPYRELATARAASLGALDQFNRPGDRRQPDDLSAKTTKELFDHLRPYMFRPDPFAARDVIGDRDAFVLLELMLRGGLATAIGINEFNEKFAPDTDISNVTGEALIRVLLDRGAIQPHPQSEVKAPSLAAPLAPTRQVVSAVEAGPLEQLKDEIQSAWKIVSGLSYFSDMDVIFQRGRRNNLKTPKDIREYLKDQINGFDRQRGFHSPGDYSVITRANSEFKRILEKLKKVEEELSMSPEAREKLRAEEAAKKAKEAEAKAIELREVLDVASQAYPVLQNVESLKGMPVDGEYVFHTLINGKPDPKSKKEGKFSGVLKEIKTEKRPPSAWSKGTSYTLTLVIEEGGRKNQFDTYITKNEDGSLRSVTNWEIMKISARGASLGLKEGDERINKVIDSVDKAAVIKVRETSATHVGLYFYNSKEAFEKGSYDSSFLIQVGRGTFPFSIYYNAEIYVTDAEEALRILEALRKKGIKDEKAVNFFGAFAEVVEAVKRFGAAKTDSEKEEAKKALVALLKEIYRVGPTIKRSITVSGREGDRYYLDSGMMTIRKTLEGVTIPGEYSVYSGISIDEHLKNWIGEQNVPQFLRAVLDAGYRLNTFEDIYDIQQLRGDVNDLSIYPAFNASGKIDPNHVFIGSVRLKEGKAVNEMERVRLPAEMLKLGRESLDDVLPADLQQGLMEDWGETSPEAKAEADQFKQFASQKKQLPSKQPLNPEKFNSPRDQRLPDEKSANTAAGLFEHFKPYEWGLNPIMARDSLGDRDAFVLLELMLRGRPALEAANDTLKRKYPANTNISQVTGEALIRMLMADGTIQPHPSSEVRGASLGSREIFEVNFDAWREVADRSNREAQKKALEALISLGEESRPMIREAELPLVLELKRLLTRNDIGKDPSINQTERSRLLQLVNRRIASIYDWKDVKAYDVVIEGHNETPFNAIFSPDGEKFVTSDGNEVQVWDTKTRKPIGNPLPAQSWVVSLKFSLDAGKLVIGGIDGHIQIWDVVKGQWIKEFLGHEPVIDKKFKEKNAQIGSIEFSPDGKTFVTASRNQTAKVWNVETGEQVGTTLQHESFVYLARFSPDGKQVLTTSEDGMARIWDLSTGKLIFAPVEVARDGDYFKEAEYILGGSQIVAAHFDGVRIFDAKTGKVIKDIWGRHTTVNADGSKFLTEAPFVSQKHEQTQINIWDAESKNVNVSLEGGTVPHALIFSPDEAFVVRAGNMDNVVPIWNSKTGRQVASLRQYTPKMGDPGPGRTDWAEFAPDGSRLLALSNYHNLRIWYPSIRKEVLDQFPQLVAEFPEIIPTSVIMPPAAPVQAITPATPGIQSAFSNFVSQPKMETLVELAKTMKEAPGGFSGGLDILTKEQIARLSDTADLFWPERFQEKWKGSIQDLENFRIELNRRIIQWLDLGKWEERQLDDINIPYPSRDKEKQFSPNGKSVFFLSYGGQLKLLDTRTGRIALELKDIKSAQFNTNGKRLFTIDEKNGLQIWDTLTGQAIGYPMPNVVGIAESSSDGKRFLYYKNDGSVQIADQNTGNPLGKPLRYPDKSIYYAAFSADGSKLFTATRDQVIQIWNPEKAEKIGKPIQLKYRIWGIEFSPDGNRLATVDAIGHGKQPVEMTLWNSLTGEVMGPPLSLDSIPAQNEMVFSPTGERLAIVKGHKSPAILLDGKSGRVISDSLKHEVAAEYGLVSYLKFSPDGKTLLTAGFNELDGTARLWNAEDGVPIGKPLLHVDTLRPSGIVLGGTYGKSPDGKTFQGLFNAQFSPDGKTLLTASNYQIRLWDPQNGTQIGKSLDNQKFFYTPDFSPDGSLVVIPSVDSSVRLLNATNGQIIGKPLTHPSSLSSVEFSPDGRMIMSITQGEELIRFIYPVLRPESDSPEVRDILFPRIKEKDMQLGKEPVLSLSNFRRYLFTIRNGVFISLQDEFSKSYREKVRGFFPSLTQEEAQNFVGMLNKWKSIVDDRLDLLNGITLKLPPQEMVKARDDLDSFEREMSRIYDDTFRDIRQYARGASLGAAPATGPLDVNQLNFLAAHVGFGTFDGDENETKKQLAAAITGTNIPAIQRQLAQHIRANLPILFEDPKEKFRILAENAQRMNRAALESRVGDMVSGLLRESPFGDLDKKVKAKAEKRLTQIFTEVLSGVSRDIAELEFQAREKIGEVAEAAYDDAVQTPEQRLDMENAKKSIPVGMDKVLPSFKQSKDKTLAVAEVGSMPLTREEAAAMIGRAFRSVPMDFLGRPLFGLTVYYAERDKDRIRGLQEYLDELRKEKSPFAGLITLKRVTQKALPDELKRHQKALKKNENLIYIVPDIGLLADAREANVISHRDSDIPENLSFVKEILSEAAVRLPHALKLKKENQPEGDRFLNHLKENLGITYYQDSQTRQIVISIDLQKFIEKLVEAQEVQRRVRVAA